MGYRNVNPGKVQTECTSWWTIVSGVGFFNLQLLTSLQIQFNTQPSKMNPRSDVQAATATTHPANKEK